MADVAPAPPPSIAPETILEEIAALRSAFRVRFVINAYPGALGPLKGGPLTYTLDSSDPEKFKAIIDDMQHRAHEPIAKLLPFTLVIGQNYAIERLASLYRKFEIDPTPHFIDIDAPRAQLYSLALANQDLKPWLDPAPLEESQQLAAFIEAQLKDFRDKFILILPKDLAPAALWTRRQFAGLYMIADEKPNPRQYRKANEPFQDRAFIVVQRKGESNPDAAVVTSLLNAGFPVALLTFSAAEPPSAYLRLIEQAAHALQLKPEPFDLAELHADPKAALNALKHETTESLANTINHAVKTRAATCAEIVFFGDLGRHPLLRKALDSGARLLFRSPLKMPAGVFEGPSDLLAEPEGCFTLLVLSATQNRFALAAFDPDRHIAEFLAAKLALERKRRLVRAILVRDLSAESIADLEEFFSRTALNIRAQ